MEFDEYGDPHVTIRLDGWSDVYRFADGMTGLQCEFAAQGNKILRAVRRKLGKQRYHAWQQDLHGRVKHP